MVTTNSAAREPGADNSLRQLRRCWWLAVGLYALAAGLSYAVLHSLGLAEPTWRWAAPVALTMGYALGLLRRNLALNHRRGETILLASFGAANAITLLRGWLLGILAGFLLFPQPAGGTAWLPVLIYTAAALTDFVDGYVARVTDQTTALGQHLDMEFDALGALLAVSLGVAYGQLPLWALLMGLARYMFVGGLAWRHRRGLPVYELPASIHGRIVAALFMSFIAVVLWPVLDPATTRFAAIWFALPLAASFGRDWLVVSGRVDPVSPGYRAALSRLQRLLTRQLPVLLRVVASACWTALVVSALRTPEGLQNAFHWPGVLNPETSAYLILVLGTLGFVSVLLGIEARLGALLLLFPAGASIDTGGLNLANGLLTACAITLLHTGPGAWALWRPSDRIFLQRLGRARS